MTLSYLYTRTHESIFTHFKYRLPVYTYAGISASTDEAAPQDKCPLQMTNMTDTTVSYLYTHTYNSIFTVCQILIMCIYNIVYGVATISRLLKIMGLFYKRAQ